MKAVEAGPEPIKSSYIWPAMFSAVSLSSGQVVPLQPSVSETPVFHFIIQVNYEKPLA